MARLVIVLGEAGSGKSYSLKTINPDESFLINVAGKELTFMGWKTKFQMYDKLTSSGNMVVPDPNNRIQHIEILLREIPKKLPQYKNFFIDDFQYIMAFDFMDKALEKGYDKFSIIGSNAYRVLKAALESPAENVFVLAHSESVYLDGARFIKMKTVGKMLDEKITPEGLTTTVLLTRIEVENQEIKHYFLTQSDGSSTARSPEGMFEYKIPNDLQLVIDKIRAYNN